MRTVRSLLRAAVFLGVTCVSWVISPARAEEVTAIALQVEQGDVAGAIRAYREQYNPGTPQGLVALRQMSIQVLRLGLRLSEPHERNVVAGVLGRLGDPAALWVLDEAVRSKEPMVRRTAADILGDLATPGAVCVLRRLYFTDAEGRRLALSGLRRTKDRTALLCYLDAVESGDAALRVQGIGGLGELRVPNTLPTLRAYLETEKDPSVALAIARALAAAGDKRGMSYLRAKLGDSKEQVRDAVVGLLGTLDDPRVIPMLRAVFRSDPSIMVRTTAAASLARFKDPQGLPLLQQALDDADFRVRLGAAIALSRMDYATAKPLVVKALASQDPLVRTNAFKVIGDAADRSMTRVVAEAVPREPDRYVKAQAVWVLGRIGDRRVLPLLLEQLTEEREEVRHSAAEAIILISDRLLAKGHEELTGSEREQ
ncbi:MAG: HEAT repeat domain-containing protein [Candidatus Binatia bacterium]|nr:HEAT repeat domain-containing protein [Candidatus Binatia bacterium]